MSGSLQDLVVVVEPDPRPDGQAVPLEERQPGRVEQRPEREQQVEDERRRQVQVRDPARLAGRAGADPRRGAAGRRVRRRGSVSPASTPPATPASSSW